MELKIISFNIRCCDDKNGNSITVKSSMIFMPVGTLAYAVKIRKEQIEK